MAANTTPLPLPRLGKKPGPTSLQHARKPFESPTVFSEEDKSVWYKRTSSSVNREPQDQEEEGQS